MTYPAMDLRMAASRGRRSPIPPSFGSSLWRGLLRPGRHRARRLIGPAFVPSGGERPLLEELTRLRRHTHPLRVRATRSESEVPPLLAPAGGSRRRRPVQGPLASSRCADDYWAFPQPLDLSQDPFVDSAKIEMARNKHLV